MSRFEYVRLADAVAADIAGGALKPGDRLPPQRTFAYERKIAASTASRVYTELLRRGLVVGEVGRGSRLPLFRMSRAACASISKSIIRCCRPRRR
jgi:DNA-binding transcriptional regulator YhcF (GntR family)